jgi:hypothetical protein
VCPLADGKGDIKLALVGDSHARQWADVVLPLALDLGWSLDLDAKDGCPFATTMKGNQAHADLCLTWTNNVSDVLLAEQYDAIFITQNHDLTYVTAPGESNENVGIAGIVEAWEPLVNAGIGFVPLRDNPRSPASVISCVENNPEAAATECVKDRDVALGTDLQLEAAARFGPDRVSVVDASNLFCSATSCPAVVGRVVVFRDASHVTETYMRTIAPYVTSDIKNALESVT